MGLLYVLMLRVAARSIPSDNPALAQVKELVFASCKAVKKIIYKQYINDKRKDFTV